MYEEQISRIKQKLPLAKKRDRHLKVFGADTHKYIIGPPVSEETVAEFEREYDISLPACYRAFVTRIGNGGPGQYGGAGPYYGIYPLGDGVYDLIEDPKTYLKEAARIYPRMTDDAWDAISGRLNGDDDVSDEEFDSSMNELFSGVLPIGTQGCTYLHAIVVSGPHKGRVVNLDLDRHKPKFAYEETFLDWYERWLDEIVSGILLRDGATWFGYSMGGDDTQLLARYESSSDDDLKVEAIDGLGKLTGITALSSEMLSGGVRCVALGELEDNGPDREIKVNLVSLLLGEGFAAAADIISGFEALDEMHEPLFQRFGYLYELGRHVEGFQLF